VIASLSLIVLPATAQAKGFLGIQFKLQEDGRGFLVQEVLDDSPADKAGLKAKDVILKIDGTEPTSLKEFLAIMGLHQPGDKIVLEIRRDGKDKKIKVTLGEMKG
jgi:serine protease Do